MKLFARLDNAILQQATGSETRTRQVHSVSKRQTGSTNRRTALEANAQFACRSTAETREVASTSYLPIESNGRPTENIEEPVVTASSSIDHSADVVLLYYCTAWQETVLHHSVRGGEWVDRKLEKVASSSGKWSCTNVDLGRSRDSTAVALEFVLNNGSEWDKLPTGENYVIDVPGVYSLKDGKLTKMEGPAFMLVSDLDDTMVGDDTASAAFKEFWENNAVLRGSSLVYNTGRSLDKFLALQSEKAHCLAPPDVLISSVGTKIYNWSGTSWSEDSMWSEHLDHGWGLDVVRDAAYAALASVGKEQMHFRPPEEQNEHKVTCGVHVSAVERVLQQIETALQAAEVQARLILSGKGEWRFLDIVPLQAGKLQALEYVRQRLGFPHERTVACGDSGNDKDMLGGENLAIVVGNAQPDLREWLAEAQQHAGGNGAAQRLLAVDGHMAHGILEGLGRFGLK